MRCLLLLAVFALTIGQALASAEQRPEGGNAPDGRRYIALVRTTDETDSVYQLEIRSIDAEKPLLATPAGGYASFTAAAKPENLRCLWSPDAKFVAIFTRGTKRSGDTKIYSIRDDTVQEVAFPDTASLLKPHVRAEIRSVWIRPEVWLPQHQLICSITGTTTGGEDQCAFRFIAFLRLHSPSPDGRPTADIASFDQDASIPFSIK